jgi:polysaccharide export outer membrane protein
MEKIQRAQWVTLIGPIVLMCVLCTGCIHNQCVCAPPDIPVPRELDKVSLPPYRIEPPDIVILDVLRTVPLPPYKIQPLDVLIVKTTEQLPGEEISGQYTVEPEGWITLGPSFGQVKVIDLTRAQAEEAIKKKIGEVLKNPDVRVSIGQTRGQQQIRGEHLIYPDGTINLGLYGSVLVSGMTIAEAKSAIEAYLSNYLERPEVSVSIGGFNSKVYYVITDGATFGETVLRFPSTGNETVLDAVALANGLQPQACTKRIWVSRPAPAQSGCYQVLPVDWDAIVRGGDTATNYQLLPGDRLYVQAQYLVTLNNIIGKLAAPVERVMGTLLLSSETVRSLRGAQSGTGTGSGF